jgi:hypothetical protein
MPFVADLLGDWEGWVAGEGLAAGTPFLISPRYEFDVVLNGLRNRRNLRSSLVLTMPSIDTAGGSGKCRSM